MAIDYPEHSRKDKSLNISLHLLAQPTEACPSLFRFARLESEPLSTQEMAHTTDCPHCLHRLELAARTGRQQHERRKILDHALLAYTAQGLKTGKLALSPMDRGVIIRYLSDNVMDPLSLQHHAEILRNASTRNATAKQVFAQGGLLSSEAIPRFARDGLDGTSDLELGSLLWNPDMLGKLSHDVLEAIGDDRLPSAGSWWLDQLMTE